MEIALPIESEMPEKDGKEQKKFANLENEGLASLPCDPPANLKARKMIWRQFNEKLRNFKLHSFSVKP